MSYYLKIATILLIIALFIGCSKKEAKEKVRQVKQEMQNEVDERQELIRQAKLTVTESVSAQKEKLGNVKESIREFAYEGNDFENLIPKAILEDLDLSDEQWRDVEKIFHETKSEIVTRLNYARERGESLSDALRSAVNDMDEKVEKVLTSEQVKKFRQRRDERKASLQSAVQKLKNED